MCTPFNKFMLYSVFPKGQKKIRSELIFFSGSKILNKRKIRYDGGTRTVRVYASQKILLQSKVIEGRNDWDRLGGLENEFLVNKPLPVS